MSLTLCSQSPTEAQHCYLWRQLCWPFIIAREYWGLTCMYSNSLYISEGNLKHKTVENSLLFLNQEIPLKWDIIVCGLLLHWGAANALQKYTLLYILSKLLIILKNNIIWLSSAKIEYESQASVLKNNRFVCMILVRQTVKIGDCTVWTPFSWPRKERGIYM